MKSSFLQESASTGLFDKAPTEASANSGSDGLYHRWTCPSASNQTGTYPLREVLSKAHDCLSYETDLRYLASTAVNLYDRVKYALSRAASMRNSSFADRIKALRVFDDALLKLDVRHTDRYAPELECVFLDAAFDLARPQLETFTSPLSSSELGEFEDFMASKVGALDRDGHSFQFTPSRPLKWRSSHFWDADGGTPADYDTGFKGKWFLVDYENIAETWVFTGRLFTRTPRLVVVPGALALYLVEAGASTFALEVPSDLDPAVLEVFATFIADGNFPSPYAAYSSALRI